MNCYHEILPRNSNPPLQDRAPSTFAWALARVPAPALGQPLRVTPQGPKGQAWAPGQLPIAIQALGRRSLPIGRSHRTADHIHTSIWYKVVRSQCIEIVYEPNGRFD